MTDANSGARTNCCGRREDRAALASKMANSLLLPFFYVPPKKHLSKQRILPDPAQSVGIELNVWRNSLMLVTKASPMKRMFSIERSAASL